MLIKSQTFGLGLIIIGERIWDNLNEDTGDEVSTVLRVRLPGRHEEAIIPVLTDSEIERIKSGRFLTSALFVSLSNNM